MKAKFFAAAAALVLMTACGNETNPLLQESPLPYGAPQFDKIKSEHYMPAFKKAMAEGKAEVDAIVNNPDAPTFQNTIEALEFSGKTLHRVGAIFYNLAEADTNDDLQAIAEELTPLMNDYEMYIALNEKLFARVKAVYEQRESLGLEPDQLRLTENTYKSFARNGANLSPEDKKKFGELNEQLGLVQLQFKKNVLGSTNAYSMNLTDQADLAGLPDFVLASASESAKEKGLEGWEFNLSAPSYSAFMKYSERRDLREKLYKAYNSRGAVEGFDNSDCVKQIANIRLQIANLLGYETFADYQISDHMAGSVQNVRDFQAKLLDPSLPVAKKEVAELFEFAKKNGFEGPVLEQWDFGYWSEKLRVAQYDLSDNELKPYFNIENCIPAVFDLAGKLYGLQFEERKDIPVYHPDVRVYDVKDAAGNHKALFYADFFPRASKRAGAWMTEFRGTKIENGVEERPFISLVTNFTKPVGDEPALITHDEFITFLHEFGHSLQGITGVGRYPSMTCTSVDHDFVELFSQFNENFGYEPEFLNTFAKNYKTGEVIPQALIDKIVAAKNYHAAYAQMRQLQYGLLDMAWYTITSPFEGDAMAFEKAALAPTDVMPSVPGCQFSTSFQHIFTGGYAAGYYSYKWSEVLSADAWSMFEENGIFDKASADKFLKMMSTGDAVEPAELYRQFRGHDPEPEALLKQLGII